MQCRLPAGPLGQLHHPQIANRLGFAQQTLSQRVTVSGEIALGLGNEVEGAQLQLAAIE